MSLPINLVSLPVPFEIGLPPPAPRPLIHYHSPSAQSSTLPTQSPTTLLGKVPNHPPYPASLPAHSSNHPPSPCAIRPTTIQSPAIPLRHPAYHHPITYLPPTIPLPNHPITNQSPHHHHHNHPPTQSPTTPNHPQHPAFSKGTSRILLETAGINFLVGYGLGMALAWIIHLQVQANIC